MSVAVEIWSGFLVSSQTFLQTTNAAATKHTFLIIRCLFSGFSGIEFLFSHYFYQNNSYLLRFSMKAYHGLLMTMLLQPMLIFIVLKEMKFLYFGHHIIGVLVYVIHKLLLFFLQIFYTIFLNLFFGIFLPTV